MEMEENENKPIPNTNGLISIHLNHDIITVLDLSHKNISAIDGNLQLPVNLMELNLTHNELREVPIVVQNLTKLKFLDISYNKIEYYDDTPKFYQEIEILNLSHNALLGPPYWIWAEKLKNLKEINLSCNNKITQLFINGYFEELLEYETLVTHITAYNCNLNNKYMKLLSTLPLAKSICLGTSELSNSRFANYIEEFPCVGLDKSTEIEHLNLINIGLFNITSDISIYINLREIDLSLNGLSDLPDEFSLLENLEVCILSLNNLLYLPETFNKLKKLFCLYLNNNCLCMLPENLCLLPFLKKLDLYDNNLNEIPEGIDNLLELDLAQNYFEEPADDEYIKKKTKLRIKSPERNNGRKVEKERPESEHSRTTDEDILYNSEIEKPVADVDNQSFSEKEDWDSDEYWIPHRGPSYTSTQSPWLYFVKRKMREGNFCPMDAHQVPIAELVEYEKYCNPKVNYESDGQFEDCSSDDD
uniref:HM00024 protein n=10 Tax=Heliconius melpomene TaxID=34740 RepID=C9S273_HELME|nr:HM00024 [Heliconius melpomene]CBH09265.1 HM00024 [Heliconius melpomene]